MTMSARQETLYHAVGMIDGTLAMRDVDNAHLQLVAITSLLIAAKLEDGERHGPTTSESFRHARRKLAAAAMLKRAAHSGRRQ